MKENVDEASISYNSVMSDDNRNYNQGNEDFAKMGYQEQRIGDDGIEDVEAEENEDIMIEESDDDSYDAE